jgi:CubicO group peptidase (beta-lactamase class C family)
VDLYGPGQKGLGFGLDFAVLTDPKAANSPQGIHSFFWGGAFGTWFWIDPTNDLVFVGMIQNRSGSTPTGGTPPTRNIAIAGTYRALTNAAR